MCSENCLVHVVKIVDRSLTIVDNTVDLIEDTLKDGGMLFIVLVTQ
jgi:hypothetical protein